MAADTNNIAQMTLLDWLDDLTVRFLLNLPPAELSSVPRLCFQVEEAQWFYEDFIRPAAAAAGNPLPSLQLRSFCLQLFQHCPLLSGFTDAQHIAAYEEFLAYKVRVPVRGAILLDEDMEKVLLVKGWKKGASWSFPRGKINKDEKDLDCAIREVFEETGFDLRAAGLVPEAGEDDVKYIDVTMREQHMKLFVFRGVPLDAHFEPQTRKEISKIDWYAIRDLPGFKKNKQQQATEANKFYMVAPFLGHLKKWINQQRKNDVLQEARPHIGAEKQTDTVKYDQAMDVEPVDKADELKKLLSVGTASMLQQTQQASNGSNLLALLQGGLRPIMPTNMPQTPLEQINTFPKQPESPHPHHSRHPSMALPQPAPQFPFSPQRIQPLQAQNNISVGTPGIFGPGPNGFYGQQSQGFPQIPQAIVNSQFFQHEQQRQNMPSMPSNAAVCGQQNDMPVNGTQPQSVSLQPWLPNQRQQPFNQNLLRAFGLQGALDSISGSPSVPNADNLPVPTLNQHSVNLLNALKSGDKPNMPPVGDYRQSRQSGPHQDALLKLLKKPSASVQTSTTPPAGRAEEPSSPTASEVTVRPTKVQDRRPTLNMITRTLPAKPKMKSPSVDMEGSPHTMQTAISSGSNPAHLKSRQLYDHANPKQAARANTDVSKPEQGTADPPVTIMQRAHLQQNPSRSPKPRRSSKPRQASPPRAPAAKGVENGTPTPAFTILARPGSAKGASKSPGLPPSSPLRNEAPKSGFQPQVLRRPESVDPVTVQKAAEIVEEKRSPGAGDKRDQLLALFGKASSPARSRPPSAKAQPTRDGIEDKRNNLLNLFNSTNKISVSPGDVSSPSTTHHVRQQPPALHIVPERNPSSQIVEHAEGVHTPQNSLPNLFTKPSAAAGSSHNSPGTPISPFTLGTPAHKLGSISLLSRSSLAQPAGSLPHSAPAAQELPRSRLNSVTTISDQDRTGVESRKTSPGNTTTPSGGNKGFLLDYLNEVVQKEGYRGSRGL